MNKRQKRMLFRILLSAVCTLLLQFLPLTGLWRLCAFLAVYLLIGYDILHKAFQGLGNLQLLDENFLMAIATVGAFALAIVSRSGDYNEAIAVMLFYQTGELFQSIAVGKSRRSIRQLMDIRPDYAHWETDGQLRTVDPEEVPIGSILVVQPGEKIPIDGVVTEGCSSLNTVALTGESLPRDVSPGSQVISGCINISGLLKIRTEKEFGQSTVNRILELVEEATSHKSRSERFIAKFARIYTPAVCATAVLLAVLPPLFTLMIGGEALWLQWLYRSLTFLVISCPCALVISIPLSFFAGIGAASRAGVLVKGSHYLETLAKVRCLVFDKTGTLTQGVFQVSGVAHNRLPEAQLLEYAALAECASSHPISKSLLAAWGGEADRRRVSDIQEHSGKGITARVDGRAIAVGNERLMAELGLTCPSAEAPGTRVHVALEGAYAGQILICDRVKPHSRRALEELKNLGIHRAVMLTGDEESIARQVAEELGIREFRSRLLPADKVTAVEQLLKQLPSGEALAFVGDGINDAPVLARADLGIAMGAMGSDAAIEAADVVLMDDDPRQIAKAIRIARKCLAIVRQNIIFSLGVKFLCLLLVAIGAANMWLGVFADVGVMVLAVLNALRAMRIK